MNRQRVADSALHYQVKSDRTWEGEGCARSEEISPTDWLSGKATSDGRWCFLIGGHSTQLHEVVDRGEVADSDDVD
jgi:hypothetical protein